MKKIAWLTDIHLNFLPEGAVNEFLTRVLDDDPDMVLITGDIAEADCLPLYLRALAGTADICSICRAREWWS